MKNIFKSALLLSLLIAASSCVLDEIDSQPASEPRLECDALEAYTIQATKPQAVSFRVNATTPWTVTVSEGANWLTVSPASSSVSSLSEDVRLTATAFDGLTDRSAEVTIKGENTDITYKISVVQLRKGKLTVTPLTEEFSAEGGSKSFSVESNLAWDVIAADSWLTFDQNHGDTDGSMKKSTIKATAAENKSIVRSTMVTVTSGDEKQTFLVKQIGQTLEFQPVESPAVDRKGGELVLNVNATVDWKVECDNDYFTVEKVGNDKVKISAPYNNIFAPRKAMVFIKPTSSDYGDVSSSIEITQDINFKLEGNYEVLSDGSVKLSCGAKSRVSTLDNYRYVSLTLKMGETHFESKGEMWCSINTKGCNIYSQLTLGGNWRIRQDGNLPNAKKPNGDAISTYKNVNLGIAKDKDVLNAMTEYKLEVLNQLSVDPDYPNVKWHVVNFWYNGKLDATLNFRSVFEDEPTAEGPYWFGFSYEDGIQNDGTWYVVKSCDVTPIAE